jgi:hypothetical protein
MFSHNRARALRFTLAMIFAILLRWALPIARFPFYRFNFEDGWLVDNYLAALIGMRASFEQPDFLGPSWTVGRSTTLVDPSPSARIYHSVPANVSKGVFRQNRMPKILTSDEGSHPLRPCSVMQLPEVRFCQEHGY